MAASLEETAFLPYYEHLMEILDTDSKLRQTRTIKQASWAAGVSVLGAVFGGPLGAGVGALAGWMLGNRSRRDYDSLVAAIRDLNNDQKEQVVVKIQGLVGSTSKVALTHFIGAQAKREALLNLLQEFASSVNARG